MRGLRGHNQELCHVALTRSDVFEEVRVEAQHAEFVETDETGDKLQDQQFLLQRQLVVPGEVLGEEKVCEPLGIAEKVQRREVEWMGLVLVFLFLRNS
jgi:hypothetical protein